jgi:hypothetical protein
MNTEKISPQRLQYELDTTTFDSYEPRIKNFGLFLEAKKEVATSEVKREAKKIISEMFAFGKNIKFSGNQNGEPEFVEFEIDASDYKLGYSEDLMMEYTEGVLKKRKYQVALHFDSKSKEGTEDKPIYKIKFKIKLKSASEVKFEEEEELAWEFENKPTKVINFIKDQKQKCEWDSSNNRLYVTKSVYKKMASDQLKTLIREEDGEKIRLRK